MAPYYPILPVPCFVVGPAVLVESCTAKALAAHGRTNIQQVAMGKKAAHHCVWWDGGYVGVCGKALMGWWGEGRGSKASQSAVRTAGACPCAPLAGQLQGPCWNCRAPSALPPAPPGKTSTKLSALSFAPSATVLPVLTPLTADDAALLSTTLGLGTC